MADSTLPTNGWLQPVLTGLPLIEPVITTVQTGPVPGTPLKGPDVQVPIGHLLVVRPSQAIIPDVDLFIAKSSADVSGGQPGPVIRVVRSTAYPYKTYVSNMNQIWVMSNSASVIVDFYVE